MRQKNSYLAIAPLGEFSQEMSSGGEPSSILFVLWL